MYPMEPTKVFTLQFLLGSVVALVVIGVLAYLMYFRAPSTLEIPDIDAGPDVGAQVSGAVETPAEKLPKTNPFKEYKNPFE